MFWFEWRAGPPQAALLALWRQKLLATLRPRVLLLLVLVLVVLVVGVAPRQHACRTPEPTTALLLHHPHLLRLLAGLPQHLQQGHPTPCPL
jgi:hypothetical protein